MSMKTKSKEVAVKAPPLEYGTPASMIMAAVAGKADLDKVEKLMLLQEKFEKRQAEKAYNRAIADFKANPPEIVKESKVEFQAAGRNVHYKYAALANVIEKVTPELSKHGLTVSWRTSQNGKVCVTCRISHELGHYEETSLAADHDTSGSKNAIQAMGSAITYMQRYTVLALLGLACSDADDDGRLSGPAVQEQPPQAQVVQPTLKDRVKEMAKTKFKTPDEFKAWRVDNNLVEDLNKATEMQLSQVWTILREVKK